MRGLALLVLLSAACAQGDPVDEDERRTRECERLRDHSIDLRLRAAPRPAGMSDEEVNRHRATLAAAAGPRFVDDCKSNWKDAQIACAQAAPNLDSLRACLPQPERN